MRSSDKGLDRALRGRGLVDVDVTWTWAGTGLHLAGGATVCLAGTGLHLADVNFYPLNGVFELN